MMPQNVSTNRTFLEVAPAQRMLMQCEGDRILLLPAWPKDWDVNFKLHAPKNTTVEGVCRAGNWSS